MKESKTLYGKGKGYPKINLWMPIQLKNLIEYDCKIFHIEHSPHGNMIPDTNEFLNRLILNYSDIYDNELNNVNKDEIKKIIESELRSKKARIIRYEQTRTDQSPLKDYSNNTIVPADKNAITIKIPKEDLTSHSIERMTSKLLELFLNYKNNNIKQEDPDNGFSDNLVKLSYKVRKEVFYKENCLYERHTAGEEGLYTVTTLKTGKDIIRIIAQFYTKPVAEREKILFSQEFMQINLAVLNENPFKFTSNKDNAQHIIYPYKLTLGKNYMYYYLLGAQMPEASSAFKEKPLLRCYHLYEVKNIKLQRNLKYDFFYQRYYKKGNDIYFNTDKTCLEKNIKNEELVNQWKQELSEDLEKTLLYDPAHPINRAKETIIHLSEQGHNLFQVIYDDRPSVKRNKKNNSYCIKKLDNGYYEYIFDCDEWQLCNYFIRFGKEAKIINNDSLKDKIVNFYKNALNSYTED